MTDADATNQTLSPKDHKRLTKKAEKLSPFDTFKLRCQVEWLETEKPPMGSKFKSNDASKKWLALSQEAQEQWEIAIEDIEFKVKLLADFDRLKAEQKNITGKSGSDPDAAAKPKAMNSYQVYFREQREKGVGSKEIPQMWKMSPDEIKYAYKLKAEHLKNQVASKDMKKD